MPNEYSEFPFGCQVFTRLNFRGMITRLVVFKFKEEYLLNRFMKLWMYGENFPEKLKRTHNTVLMENLP